MPRQADAPRSSADVIPEALEVEPGAADVRFLLGRAQVASGDFGAARKAFGAARDRDQLRFRAPEEFNGILAELAEASDVRLVDVRARFEQVAANGIVGADLMLEHVEVGESSTGNGGAGAAEVAAEKPDDESLDTYIEGIEKKMLEDALKKARYNKTRAAESLAGEGVSVELLHYPSLKPFDAETLVASARKTGAVVIE